MRGHRGHERGQKSNGEQAQQAGGQKLEHQQRVAGFRIIEAGVRHKRHQANQNPRPGPQRIMRHVKQKRAAHRMPLILCREHPLGNVPTPARFGARIPGGPPHHPDPNQRSCQRDLRVGEWIERKHRVIRAKLQCKIGFELPQAAGVIHRIPRQYHRPAHRDDKLNKIGNHDAPDPGKRDVQADREVERKNDDPLGLHFEVRPTHSRAEKRQRHRMILHAQQHRKDFGHANRHPAENDAVDRKRKVECPKPSQNPRRPARIADRDKLHIGDHIGALPEFGVEKHRHQAGKHEIPPDPNARDPFGCNNPGDGGRRVGGKRSGDHGDADQPPREIFPAGKVVGKRFLPAPGGERANHDHQQYIRDDHGIIESLKRKSHGG